MTPVFRPLWPAVAILCLVFCITYCRGSRQLLSTPAPSPTSREEDTLLQFVALLDNFKGTAVADRLSGWGVDSSQLCGDPAQARTSDVSECSPENQIYRNAARNSWTGVTCNSASEVVCIHLPDANLAGPAAAISQLAGLGSLGYLNLAGNRLTGELSSDLGLLLRSLQTLDLSSNDINGTLAAGWSSEGSWPDLQLLGLESNAISGTLPSAWGSTGSWSSLQVLNLSDNRLQGSVPSSFAANESGLSSLQQAILQPGNDFCGSVPDGFPAVRSTGEYVTGPTYQAVTDFDGSCPSPQELGEESIRAASGDSSGDDLSHTAVAGIITGEVLFGTFLLLVSGTIHRRYRWRHERSWVLFDWDVGAESPSKPLLNLLRFGWGSKPSSTNGNFGAIESNGFAPNGSLSPPSLSGHGLEAVDGPLPTASPPAQGGPVEREHAPVATAPPVVLPQAGDQERPRGSSIGSISDLIWQDSLLPTQDVVIQTNADGSLRKLGNGSFGKVYKGLYQQAHEIAVKVFEGYAGQREQDLLLKEISILRSCRNNNIVQFFGVVLQESDIWMIMELMDGNLFRHLARGHHCTWYFRGRSIALDVARGMHFLHSRRIIHMDLKSPNILLSNAGSAKIADVGLARVMGSESIANQVVAGTMHWMAPEVLINGRCTEKADIFSFGVILWEICTAEAPTRGRMEAVSVPDECPEEVARLIEWCMEEDPEKRPSALKIIERIQSIPVTSRPVPQPPWYAR